MAKIPGVAVRPSTPRRTDRANPTVARGKAVASVEGLATSGEPTAYKPKPNKGLGFRV